jgi:hypothetical protein
MAVFTSPQIRVSINNQQRNTIRTVGVAPSVTDLGINRLTQLIDVDASDSENNETLVYDSTSQKYVVKTLPTINGGSY